MKKKTKTKTKTKTKIASLTILISFMIAGIIYIALPSKIQEEQIQINEKLEEEIDEVLVSEIEEEKQVQTFSGLDRPIAVMLDNSKSAWPQIGINSAYMVYEIIVEGNETRLMALYKGVDVETIGGVRSARPYFLDYALEHDAIYVHFGGSDQALSDISTLSVRNINGMYEDGTTFTRATNRYAPHNAMTSTKNIYESAESKNYKLESQIGSVLTYSAEEVVREDGIDANKVVVPHSTMQTVEYNYDEETKTYIRTARGILQEDGATDEEIRTKNIIIQLCYNYSLDSVGRQALSNIGTLDGYYISNGKAIEIKCTKDARRGQTVYTDLEGNEIVVNDGNTFVNICTINANVEITGM